MIRLHASAAHIHYKYVYSFKNIDKEVRPVVHSIGHKLRSQAVLYSSGEVTRKELFDNNHPYGYRNRDERFLDYIINYRTASGRFRRGWRIYNFPNGSVVKNTSPTQQHIIDSVMQNSYMVPRNIFQHLEKIYYKYVKEGEKRIYLIGRSKIDKIKQIASGGT